MRSSVLCLYHRLPAPARSIAASLRGLYLRPWRYGPETDGLVEAAPGRDSWNESGWTSDRLLTLYHRPPSALQSAGATARGLALRSSHCGPGKSEGALEATRREIVELRLEGAMGFAGAVAHEEVARYLAGADIFLNTTSFDNTPVRRSAFSKPWRVASAS